MSTLHISLFGKLRIASKGQTEPGLEARKAQELLCYLLVHRERSHFRETLASLLWEESSAQQAKKYLRQALWQVQSKLDASATRQNSGNPSPILEDQQVFQVETEWIRLNPTADIWVDAHEIDQVYSDLQSIPGQNLDGQQAAQLKQAVELYRGELLEGWFQDWCIFERERYQVVYLAMLDQLIDFCASRRAYDEGIMYGMRSLRYDRARERTHRKLMRLHYSTGNRAGAMSQYRTCVEVLADELDVEPVGRTVDLYEQIRGGRVDSLSTHEADPPVVASSERPDVERVESAPLPLQHLRLIQKTLLHLNRQVEQCIRDLSEPVRRP